MTEYDLQMVYYYPIYPKDSKINSVEGFAKIDNGSLGGTHPTRFHIKDNKS